MTTMTPFIFNVDLFDRVDVARHDYVNFFIENIISKLSLSFK